MREMRCWPERPSYLAYIKFEGTEDEQPLDDSFIGRKTFFALSGI